MSGQPAVFLDRDGTLNELAPDPVTGLPESPLNPTDARLMSGAADAVGRLLDAGFLVVVITNQPAAAKGFTTPENLAEIHVWVLSQLASEDVLVDTSRMCLHHPDGVVPDLTLICSCRKPEPGMLLDAALELDIDLASSWMIGDADSDITAGKRAGCRTVLIEYPPSAHRRSGTITADLVADSLAEGVASLLTEAGC